MGLLRECCRAHLLQGKWTAEEEERLKELVTQKGRKWKEIGAALNRMPESCRDKHKEIVLGQAKKKGRWDKEETNRLRDAVHAYLAKRIVSRNPFTHGATSAYA